MTLDRRTAALLLSFALALAGSPAAQTRRPAPSKAPSKSQTQPDPLTALLRQAQDAINKIDYEAAVQPLESYLAARPNDADIHFQLGYVYSELKRWDDAASEYRKAIALNPKFAAAYLNLGLVLLERDPSSAVAPFKQAADLLPDQARPRYLVGLALERSGRLNDAVEQYQAAVELDAKNYEIRFALGRALLRLDRAAEAEAQFREALALRTDSAPAHLGLANSLLAEQKPETAAEEFGKYLELAPQDRAMRLERASLLADLKKYDEALAELDRADAGAPPQLDSARLRAAVYVQRKQWAEAAAVLEKALPLAPNDATLHAELGRAMLEQRQFAPAVRELRIALQLNPGGIGALKDLSVVYYLSQDYPATLAALDELARRETPNAGAWFVRATCYDKLGKKPEAVDAYRKFLELDQGRDDTQDFQARERLKLLLRELQRNQ